MNKIYEFQIARSFLLLLALPTCCASAATRYVWQGSPSPTPPYDSWATAATVIQDAVDAADPGDTVLVTNGVYATGERFAGSGTNRVVVDKPLTVESVNGPQFTAILGSLTPQIRCVYLADDATLSGFTLTNGFAMSGGALWCQSTNAAVTNCVLTGNRASISGGGAYSGTLNNCTLTDNNTSGDFSSIGGGAAYCTLNHCALTGNVALGAGGGAYGGTLNNCTVSGNLAGFGGGVYAATLNNCIVYYNEFSNSGGACTFDFSCTTPLPAGGVGNIDLGPLFVDTNGWSNLRLQSNSPCINAGKNAYVTSLTDLDGNPRIVSGTVDMGAYEYQGAGSVISYAWLQHYGLPTDGSADTLDTDMDGHNTWQEWKCWTDPTNALSVLRLLTPQPDTNGMVVSWQSVLGQTYSVGRATNASGPFSLLQGNFPGQAGTTSVTDTNPADGNPILYRVAVP